MSAAAQLATEASPALHRLREVRRDQEVSLRTMARELGLTVAEILVRERADYDLRLSELLAWQRVLDVPLAELLVDPGASGLSPLVAERARLLRLMKSARSLVEHTPPGALRIMAENLVAQVLELMPELQEVSPWPSRGQQRSPAEPGEAAVHEVRVPNGVRRWVESMARTSSHPRGDVV